MKFRAKMTDHYAIKQFHNIMVSMTRLSKQCYLRLTKDSFYFIADDYSSIGGASVWCEMEYDKFFKECVQEGVTEEDPDIYIQLHPGPLTQTLAVIKTTNSTSIKSLKIKLTRKEQIPCLSFTVEMSPSVRQCVQDVPIHLVPRKDWSDIAQPTYDLVPNQYISIILPDVKRLKYMLDRYKTLGNYVTLEAFFIGDLIIKLESDRLKLSTHFRNCEVVESPGISTNNPSDNEELSNEDSVPSSVQVSVELKKLALFLSADTFGAKRIITHIIKDKVLHIQFVNDEITMQFYIPAVQI